MYNPQITHDRIMQLLQAQNDTAKNMTVALGLGVNAIHNAQHNKHGMRCATLCAIADYLHCSADYLLGRTNTP